MSPVGYHGTPWLPVPPAELWETAGRFDLFESWWGWLRDFETDQGGLVDGYALHGTVIPPVPWRLCLDVRLRRRRPPRLIEAQVTGDLRGPAVLELEEAGEGTLVAMAWSLEMNSAPLRAAARIAYPLMRWGHDRVVDLTVSGFRQRALPAIVGAPGPGSGGRRLPQPPDPAIPFASPEPE